MVDLNDKTVATNRRARHEYDILDTWEAGLVLQGSEVKSLRESKVQIAESYVRPEGPEPVAYTHLTLPTIYSV